jgi:hypothetical protein
MELAALAHIVQTSRARGDDPSVAGTSLNLVRAAIDAGHGKDGYSRVVTVLRRGRDPVNRSRVRSGSE